MKAADERDRVSQKNPPSTPTGKGEEVLQAAIDLFARYGYRKTSVDEIADAAKVAKRTVYLHFENKAAIFCAMAEYMADLTRRRFEEALQSKGTPEDRFTALLYANYGTAFERFGASEQVEDLELAGRELLAASIIAWAQEYEDRMTVFLEELRGESEIAGPPPGLTLAKMVRITMRGADAAKHDPTIRGNVEAYRERLRELALFMLAALRR